MLRCFIWISTNKPWGCCYTIILYLQGNVTNCEYESYKGVVFLSVGFICLCACVTAILLIWNSYPWILSILHPLNQQLWLNTIVGFTFDCDWLNRHVLRNYLSIYYVICHDGEKFWMLLTLKLRMLGHYFKWTFLYRS